jgi:hypothetical protein
MDEDDGGQPMDALTTEAAAVDDLDPYLDGEDLITLFWLSYLGQWGPPYKQPEERRQHVWRLHMLRMMIGEVLHQVDDDDEDDDHWNDFLDSLPGHSEYWACGCSFAQHWGISGSPPPCGA